MKAPQEFNKRDVERVLIYDLKAFRTIRDSFIYVHTLLSQQGYGYDLNKNSSPDFNKLKWSEGKNYQWLALCMGDKDGSTQFLIRQYGRHLTVFTKFSYSEESYRDTVYACFTFNTNNDKMNATQREASDLNENFFHEFQIAFPEILRLVNENKLHSLWNNRDLPRPSYVDVKTAFYGETIISIDLLIFGAEELTQKHMELFAENDMLDMLKSLREVSGRDFDANNKVKEVVTDFPKQYSDPYYHGVGIAVVDAKDKRSFHDVYTLTRYYFDEVLALRSS